MVIVHQVMQGAPAHEVMGLELARDLADLSVSLPWTARQYLHHFLGFTFWDVSVENQ